jgi:hypothetical protein
VTIDIAFVTIESYIQAMSRGRAVNAKIPRIEDGLELVRYAGLAQIARLRRDGIATQEELAHLAGSTNSHVTKSFNGTIKGGPTNELQRKLDQVILLLDQKLAANGGLSALSVRLRRSRDKLDLTARIPPSWIADLLSRPAANEVGVLMQGSALLSMFQTAPARAADVVRGQRDTIDLMIDRLIYIGASPPTPRNVDALLLLGSLARYAFDVVRPGIEKVLTQEPLGFRVWRAITSIVVLTEEGQPSHSDLSDWVRIQLERANEMRKTSLFPGRSLDLEAAIAIPLSWSPPGHDWVAEVLKKRAENKQAVVRERGTAAHGLWERSIQHNSPSRDEVRTYLKNLITQYRQEATEAGDVAIGLNWVADTLEKNLTTGELVCNEWPDSDQPCLRAVRDSVSTLKVEPNIRDATTRLVEHAVLQNAGVYRRQAIDTLLAGGWAAEVTSVLEHVLEHHDSEPWLRCRALFALSFLHERSTRTARILVDAYRRALERLSNSILRGAISEMHAALFAIGDCFGAPGAEEMATWIREEIDPTLKLLFKRSHEEDALARVARAAAYVVTVTAHVAPDSTWQMLELYRHHRDPATSRFCQWALDNRFSSPQRGEHTVTPLHRIPLGRQL